jgi:hypothetical protein
MYYAGKLGLAAVETFNDNYLGFSIYVIVCGLYWGRAAFSFEKQATQAP